jgi:PAS domain S-box-containing protein
LDITTDVKNREVIALAKERLDLAADAGSLGIWDIDLLSNTYAWDDRMYQHYGLDPSAKIAPETVWFKLVHPDDLAQVVAETKSAIASGGRSVSEFRIIRQDGSMHHMRSCAIAVRGSGDKVARITGINQDITEAKRFAAELREARRVADEANVAKGQFLANMSHEIRTPLNAIIGLSELVMRTELTTRQRHYLENISAAGHSLLSVINDVLDFSKIESGKFDVENVDFTLSDVLDRLASMTGLRAQEKGLELLYAISPDVPKVLIGDAGRLGQVLLNLVSNAIKFSASGEIVLTGRREMQQGNPVRLRFEVQDTGIGLSAEQAVRLFQPFVQADASTSRQFGGTGLGLVISKKLVELMGGNIHVESTQGQGSRFIFTVQMGQPDTAPADLPTIAWRADFSRLRVLVIDDNQSARQILVDTLQSLGLYAVAVERGDLGIDELAAAQRAGQAYDLAIIDRQMPMLDGVETIRRIRADERIAKTLATVMLTAFGAEELRAAAFGVHLDAILEKPVHPEKLFRLITQILPAGMAIQSSAGLVERSKQRMNGQEPYLTGARVLLVEDNKLNQEVATELLKATGMTVALAEDGF